jgi:hypothetical protein
MLPPAEAHTMDRRDAIATILAVGAALTVGPAPKASADQQRVIRADMQIACVVRYQIDPFKRDGFKRHAERLIPIVPRCGGHLVGFFLPYEGTNDVAWALVLVESVAAYETYRARLKADPAAREDAEIMQRDRIILREERNFVSLVDGTFNLPSALRGPT